MFLKEVYNILGSRQNFKIILIISIVIISVVFELFSLAVIIPLIAYIFQLQDFHSIFIQITNNQLIKGIDTGIILSLFFFLGILVKNIFLFFSIKILYQNIFEIEKIIANKILKNYLFSDFKFFSKNSSSTLTHYLTQEIWKFRDILIASFHFISDLIIIFGIIILLLINNFKVTLMLIIIISIFSIIIIKFYREKLERLGEEKLKFEKIRIGQLSSIFRLIKEILVTNKQFFFLKKFIENYEFLIVPSVYQSILRIIPKMWIEIFFSLSVSTFFIIIIFNDLYIIEIIPQIIFYIACLLRLLPTVNRILHSNQVITFGTPTIKILNEQLELKNNFHQKNDYYKNNFNFQKNITLDNINFSYPKKEAILKNINLKVKKNSIIAIVGKSGSGKTTLLNILLGLVKDYEGNILIDNKYDIKNNINIWQNKIGFIPQSIFVFNDTLKNNIALGIEEKNISRQQLHAVIEKSKIDEFIKNLPNKEDTILNEDGKNLSGGQIQRIGIARALYNDPEILILDEPTSALDVKIEKEIFQILKRLNKTIIFVTHNANNLDICDEIYELKNNKLTQVR